MKLRWLRCVLSALTLCFLCSCGGGGGSSIDICSALKVDNGKECALANSAVVRILIAKPYGLMSCSGTVISPTAVLTAYHCIENMLIFPEVLTSSGLSSSASEVYGINGYETYRLPGYDAAVLIMPSDFIAQAGITPIPLAFDREPGAGDRFLVFGYGLDAEDQGAGLYPRGASMTLVNRTIANGLYTFEFLGTPDSGTTCKGDSGGPALFEFGSKYAVKGIISRGEYSGDCSIDGNTRFGDIASPSILPMIKSVAPDYYWMNESECYPASLCE